MTPGSPFSQACLFNKLHYISGFERAGRLTVAGVDQLVRFVLFHSRHKGIRQSHRDIEIGQLRRVGLALDKIENIRMINPQETHVGASSRAALLDRLRADIKDPHEGDGAAGNP